MASFLNDVKFTSSTSGTADFGIGAAASGFQTPATAGAVDETSYSYTARSGAQFESGVGSYEATGPVLERTTVLDSSAGFGVKVNFTSAPTVILSPLKEDFREVLTANRTYYVRTDGSDSNNGLANTAGGAWLTPQHAADAIAKTIDFGGFKITVQIGAGDYDGFAIGHLYSSTAVENSLVDYLGNGTLFFAGDATDEEAVKIAVMPSNGSNVMVMANSPVYAGIKDLTIDCRNTPPGAPLYIAGGAFFYVGDGGGGTVKFLSATAHSAGEPFAATTSGQILVSDNVIIDNGTWDYILRADQRGYIFLGWFSSAVFTLVNSPVVAGSFAMAGFTNIDSYGAIMCYDCSFTGTTTGTRFQVLGPGSFIDVDTPAGGLDFFPGDAAGVCSRGGSYSYRDGGVNKVLTSPRSIVALNGRTALDLDGGTQINSSSPALNITQTWDNAATAFTADKTNVTVTAALTASKLKDWQVGGTSGISIQRVPAVPNFTNATGLRMVFGTDAALSWSADYVAMMLTNAAITDYVNLRVSNISSVSSNIINGGSSGSLNVEATVEIAGQSWRAAYQVINLTSSSGISWTDGNVGGTADVTLVRAAAATLQLGKPDAATAVAQTLQIQGVVAGTTNIAGANWTLAGSKGTGTGAGGQIILRTAPAGASGSSQNALATGLTITAPAVNMQPSVVVGNAALATDATDGFLYIPTCAGTPTGAPTAHTGRVAMVFDTTNNKFYIYDGSWLGGTAPGAFS